MRQVIAALVIGILLGWMSHSVLPQDVQAAEQPLGNTEDRASPGDWVKENQIKVLSDQIIIEVPHAQWSAFLNTHSMDPVLDTGANGLQVAPQSPNQLSIGHIISYDIGNGPIIHRIVSIGNDGEWYAIAKGDNNAFADPVKVRFNEIRRVLIGIIY